MWPDHVAGIKNQIKIKYSLSRTYAYNSGDSRQPPPASTMELILQFCVIQADRDSVAIPTANELPPIALITPRLLGPTSSDVKTKLTIICPL